VNVLSRLWEKLARSKRYRESFAASVVKRMIPLQIRVLRKQRGWSQVDLAKESKLTQGVISRAEDPDYGNLTVNTLVRIGAGFDCAYVGRFVPFSELGRWYANLSNEKALEVPSFNDDHGFVNMTEPLHGIETNVLGGSILTDAHRFISLSEVYARPLNVGVIPGATSVGLITRKPAGSERKYYFETATGDAYGRI